MKRQHWFATKRWIAPWFLVLVALLCAEPTVGADEPEQKPATETPVPVKKVVLDLPTCLELALQRHPRIAASRDSLASAEASKHALDLLRVPEALVPDLPIRRRQAALGVMAAAAALDRAQGEVVYGVKRTWFTVQYAREQETLATSVVDRLNTVYRAAKTQLDAGARDASETEVNRTLVYVRLAETKQIEARVGVKRALASLREAIGAPPGFCFDVPTTGLPSLDRHPCLDEVVALALARRGDLIQASIFAQVATLEIDAQASSSRKQMNTFAAGSDVHSREVPQTLTGTEYRPGAVPPEMPTLLAGERWARVKRAHALAARGWDVVELARSLIALETEDAYFRWEQSFQQAAKAKEAADTGKKLADRLDRDFTSGLKVSVREVVEARVLGSQAQSEYHQYLQHLIIALADLERASAGGFHAGLVEASTRPKPTEDKEKDKEKEKKEKEKPDAGPLFK